VNDPMRLMLSAYACRPNAGSEPGYGWNWATHLAARGIEVHVLVAQRNQQPIEAVPPPPNVKFHFIRVPEWVKKSEAVHYMLWQAEALKVAKKLHAELAFDIAHHVTYGSVHVPTQLWRLGIPVIFGPVGGGQTAPASMLEYFGADKAKERFRTLTTRLLKISPFHRRSLKRMSFVLAANQDTLDLVQTLGCKNATVMCDAGLPADYFARQPRKFGRRRGAIKLLWAGRMLARKALPLALDALKEVRQNITLTIAGDGMDPQLVHQMIRERNLEDRIFWKGTSLSWAETRTAYAKHDAMLFTSLRDSFGSQMLEAMAMGLPIITLDLHGAHDFVPAAASLKIPVSGPRETVPKLACAIEEYASFSTQKKNEMSKQAWNFARTLSWPARAEFAENLYQQVLSGSEFPARAAKSTVTAVCVQA
jgi:glycosyltransferase involved in cell wall biosynthesis